MKRSPIHRIAALLLAVCSAACGVGHEATPSATPKGTISTDSAAGRAVVDSSGARAPAPISASPARPVVAQPAEPDTAAPSLIVGRKKHDSASFASTVAFGRQMVEKWPAIPSPLPGSIFPSRRIVAFYGNPLSKRMGVLG